MFSSSIRRSARRPLRAAQPIRRSVRLMLEALEERLAPAGAIDIVNSVADDNSGATVWGQLMGTLRYVVNHAAANDTIVFSPNLKGQTIVLTGGEITLNKSLIIDGQGNKISITTNNTSRAFYESEASLVEAIYDLTFSSNAAADTGAPDFGNGGAIDCNCPLSLTGDTFSLNTAANAGGAVCNVNRTGSTSVSNCTFVTNTATNGSGGAIWGYTALSIGGSTFSGNRAGLSGGAVAYRFVPADGVIPRLTVTGVTFAGNKAAKDGGAVACVIDASQSNVAVGI